MAGVTGRMMPADNRFIYIHIGFTFTQPTSYLIIISPNSHIISK